MSKAGAVECHGSLRPLRSMADWKMLPVDVVLPDPPRGTRPQLRVIQGYTHRVRPPEKLKEIVATVNIIAGPFPCI